MTRRSSGRAEQRPYQTTGARSSFCRGLRAAACAICLSSDTFTSLTPLSTAEVHCGKTGPKPFFFFFLTNSQTVKCIFLCFVIYCVVLVGFSAFVCPYLNLNLVALSCFNDKGLIQSNQINLNIALYNNLKGPQSTLQQRKHTVIDIT